MSRVRIPFSEELVPEERIDRGSLLRRVDLVLGGFHWKWQQDIGLLR